MKKFAGVTRVDDHARIQRREEIRGAYCWRRMSELQAGGVDTAAAWRLVEREINEGAALQSQPTTVTRSRA